MDETIYQAVFVLGMHRSGTSWFTGALQQAGLHLGMHHTWNAHNRKGNKVLRPSLPSLGHPT